MLSLPPRSSPPAATALPLTWVALGPGRSRTAPTRHPAEAQAVLVADPTVRTASTGDDDGTPARAVREPTAQPRPTHYPATAQPTTPRHPVRHPADRRARCGTGAEAEPVFEKGPSTSAGVAVGVIVQDQIPSSRGGVQTGGRLGASSRARPRAVSTAPSVRRVAVVARTLLGLVCCPAARVAPGCGRDLRPFAGARPSRLRPQLRPHTTPRPPPLPRTARHITPVNRARNRRPSSRPGRPSARRRRSAPRPPRVRPRRPDRISHRARGPRPVRLRDTGDRCGHRTDHLGCCRRQPGGATGRPTAGWYTVHRHRARRAAVLAAHVTGRAPRGCSTPERRAARREVSVDRQDSSATRFAVTRVAAVPEGPLPTDKGRCTAPWTPPTAPDHVRR
jgi:hypothetical protein